MWSRLLALMFTVVAPIAAQAPASASRGDRVQLGAPDGAADRTFQACTARVAAVQHDTLVLESASACLRGTYDASVRVAEVHRGSRLAHAAIGFAGGALIGGLVGRLAAGDGCNVSGCDDGGLSIAILTVAGTGAGALLGTIIGAALPAGTRWGPLNARQPVRIAGMALRPGIHLARAAIPRR